MKKYSNLFLFLGLSSLIAVSIFGVHFLYQKVQNALNTQQRIALEQEIQTEQIKNIPELATRYQKILDNEQHFAFLYSEDELVEVIKDMERLAKEQGITLTITQKEVPKQKASLKKGEIAEEEGSETIAVATPKELVDNLPYEKSIRLELKAQGSYLALRNFLHALETAPYALDILALQGTVAPPENGDQPVARAQTASPFLLGSNQPEATGETAVNPNRILFLIETALYIQ